MQYIEIGAQGWSADGLRPLGNVPSSLCNKQIVTAGTRKTEKGTFTIIDSPRWANGNQFCVSPVYIKGIADTGQDNPPQTEKQPPHPEIIVKDEDGALWSYIPNGPYEPAN